MDGAQQTCVIALVSQTLGQVALGGDGFESRTSNSIEPKSNFRTDLHIYRKAILHGGLEAPGALFVHGLRNGLRKECQTLPKAGIMVRQ